MTKSGWTTARKMAASTWEERTRVLNHAGYARYDEKTSRRLAETSNLLLKCYNGDLRKLREAAERDPAPFTKPSFDRPLGDSNHIGKPLVRDVKGFLQPLVNPSRNAAPYHRHYFRGIADIHVRSS